QDQSRNNQLELTALAQIRSEVDAAIARFGAERIAIILGTTTSGIAETETALQQQKTSGVFPPHFPYGQQELSSPAQALALTLGTSGPTYVHSSAC
ncbi:beta-ketoacyl-[acyl-carrier-protein] synthase II, partial [Acinetobacter baumannii]